MTISEESAKKLIDIITKLSSPQQSTQEPSLQKIEPQKSRTYKCTGTDCNFSTSDPDEYITHRMGDVYAEQQAAKQEVEKLKTELNTIKNPPKQEHTHDWESYGLFTRHCKNCGEVTQKDDEE